jgi:hypothetical protein
MCVEEGRRRRKEFPLVGSGTTTSMGGISQRDASPPEGVEGVDSIEHECTLRTGLCQLLHLVCSKG